MHGPHSGVAAMMLVLAAATTSVSGHGLMSKPASRNWRCGKEILPHVSAGTECEPAFADWHGTYYNNGHQYMSVLSHSGGRKEVTPLPQHVCGFASEKWDGGETPWDTPYDWPTNPMSPGRNQIDWDISWGPHFSDTSDFRYWITKPEFQFDPTKALQWSDFEDQPFCDLPYKHGASNVDVETSGSTFKTYCNVPTRSGRHVIYGEWGRGPGTFERFHGCIDITMEGGSTTPSAPGTQPQPQPRPLPQPTPTPAAGSGVGWGPQCNHQAGEWGNCQAEGNCCVEGTTCYEMNADYAQCRKDCPSGWSCVVRTAQSKSIVGQPATQPQPVPQPPQQPQPQPTQPPQPQPTQPQPRPQPTQPPQPVPQPQPQPTQGQCNCDCNAQPQPQPQPTTPVAPRPNPVPPTSSCATTVPEYAGCLNARGCCAAGTQCYEMNQYYAQCRKSCPSDRWSCKVLQ